MNDDLKKEFEKTMKEADALLERLKQQADKGEKLPLLMIVEDDKNVVKGLQNLFEDDYQMAVFYDASSALEAMKTLAPSAAILDMKLPDMHGLKLLQKVKNINPYLPIVVHTGYPGEYSEQDVRSIGSDLYVTKGSPDSIDKLMNFTENAIETYEKFKRSIVEGLVEDFSEGHKCRYSAVFDQVEGKLYDKSEISQLAPKEIYSNSDLVALCYISNDLISMKQDEGAKHTICPFHQETHPAEGNQIMHTGELTSAPCIYYNHLRFGNIKPELLEKLNEGEHGST